MKRKLIFKIPLLLICCVSFFFASGSTASVQMQGETHPAMQSMKLPKIGSQKSEYDYIYGMKMAGNGKNGVPPLPNAFVHPEPQPLQ